MLYFDNAATSFPKPAEVKSAVREAFEFYGANPGRSGHKMAQETGAAVFKCRQKAAEFFGCKEIENVVFTKNCTEALNTVIMSILSEGGHCVTSDLEHNSVSRPLFELERKGKASWSAARVSENDPEETLKAFDKAFKKDTKLLAVTGASNAFGIKPPVTELAELAHEHGALFLLDAAQTAGSEDYDMEAQGFDFVCAPGHKGLNGPMGTGLLLTRLPESLKPLTFGGTGNYSLRLEQEGELPEVLESGTINVPGICGLCAGIESVSVEGAEKIGEREIQLAQFIFSELQKICGVKLFTGFPRRETHVPVISFTLGDLTGEETAARLAEKGAALRGGFQCAALAHRKMGTEKRGTCRISVGRYNTFREAQELIKLIYAQAKICS